MKLSEKFMMRFSDICCDHTGVAAIDDKFRQMTKRRKRHGFKGMPARLGTEEALKRVLEEFSASITVYGPTILTEDFDDQRKHWVFDFYNESDFSYLEFTDKSRIYVEYNCEGQCALHRY